MKAIGCDRCGSALIEHSSDLRGSFSLVCKINGQLKDGGNERSYPSFFRSSTAPIGVAVREGKASSYCGRSGALPRGRYRRRLLSGRKGASQGQYVVGIRR